MNNVRSNYVGKPERRRGPRARHTVGPRLDVCGKVRESKSEERTEGRRDRGCAESDEVPRTHRDGSRCCRLTQQTPLELEALGVKI